MALSASFEMVFFEWLALVDTYGGKGGLEKVCGDRFLLGAGVGIFCASGGRDGAVVADFVNFV